MLGNEARGSCAKGGVVDHPLPWLRYIDADAVGDQTLDFDGMKVRNAAMEKLGEVDGFIVDADSARPYYVVVDSGGWFKSKHFLVPIGHAKLDDDRCLALADEADKRAASGAPLPPLHGLPTAFKDLQPAVGFPWTRGSLAYKDAMPTEDSLFVARMRAAGVIPIGKTGEERREHPR